MNEASPDDLLRGLRGLIENGAVRLELDLGKLDQMDSPVAVEADSNIWVYGAIPFCALVFWQIGERSVAAHPRSIAGSWTKTQALKICFLFELQPRPRALLYPHHNDDERSGALVKDEPVVIHCYTIPVNVQDPRRLAEVGDFCRRMGREAHQGEIGLVIADEYFAITDF